MNHFKDLFKESQCSSDSEILDTIMQKVTQTDNHHLVTLQSANEIRKIVMEMSSDNTPGPDRFLVFFKKVVV